MKHTELTSIVAVIAAGGTLGPGGVFLYLAVEFVGHRLALPLLRDARIKKTA